MFSVLYFFFFQAEDGIRDKLVTGVQTCALPISFDIETKELAKHSQSGGEFFGIHASNNGKIMIFAGGIPLKLDGKVVGAVGVSGGFGGEEHDRAAGGAAPGFLQKRKQTHLLTFFLTTSSFP